jgi:hypothetical protein
MIFSFFLKKIENLFVKIFANINKTNDKGVKMKKSKIFVSLFAVLGVAILSGCAMCNEPIKGDDSCIETSHNASAMVKPENISYSQPKIVPCTDVFKPNFEAGKERCVVIGTGNSLESATADAIARFMEKTNCDYIVGTTRVITVKTHPTYRFFATSNYTVKLSGIPVTLARLEKVLPPKKAPAPVVVAPSLTKDDVKTIVKQIIVEKPKAEKKCCPLGMIKLTDINVKVDAKAVAEDPAGLVFPAKKK